MANSKKYNNNFDNFMDSLDMKFLNWLKQIEKKLYITFTSKKYFTQI